MPAALFSFNNFIPSDNSKTVAPKKNKERLFHFFEWRTFSNWFEFKDLQNSATIEMNLLLNMCTMYFTSVIIKPLSSSKGIFSFLFVHPVISLRSV